MKAALKGAARDLAGAVLWRAGVTRPRARASGRLSIVTFHRVLPRELVAQYPYPVLSVSPEELAWFVEYFREYYTVGPLTEMLRRFRGGESPKKPLLAITFDDGQKDNYTYGWPVLERAGVRASFYIVAARMEAKTPLWHDALGFAILAGLERGAETRRTFTSLFGIDPAQHPVPSVYATEVSHALKKLRPEERDERVVRARELAGGTVPEWSHLMSWDDAKELARAGNELGSHSMTHPLLPQLDERGLEYEIAGSRRMIAEKTGAPVDSFCYPNGDHTSRIVDITRRAGYENAVTALFGNNARGTDPFRLERYDIIARASLGRDGALSAKRLAWWMSGFYPTKLSY